MLTPPQLFQPTQHISVSLDLLRSAKPLRDRARVHFHSFTAETIATVSLLGAKQLPPGESALARLTLDDPLLLLPGDRFIVRQFSPVITIGGGRILDAAEQPRRTGPRNGWHSCRLSLKRILKTHCWRGFHAVARHGLSVSEAVAETGLLSAKINEIADGLEGRPSWFALRTSCCRKVNCRIAARPNGSEGRTVPQIESAGAGDQQGAVARNPRLAAGSFSRGAGGAGSRPETRGQRRDCARGRQGRSSA